jgi:ribosomal protein S4
MAKKKNTRMFTREQRQANRSVMKNQDQAKERLDQGFSVFNCHINNAKERADAEYKSQLGEKSWLKHIAPLHTKGIMSIFDDAPTPETAAWVVLCTAYVNENRT